MEIIKCGLGYEIETAFDVTDQLKALLEEDNIYVVTDRNLMKHYGAKLALRALGDRLCVVRAGENSKQLKTAARICARMLEAGCDRKTKLIAFGGGVIGDLGGFVAAIYMRGIRYTQVPTSLLAMVDSSVGGKTGVDLGCVKNIIGAFKQPDRVLVGINFLSTLDMREIFSGLGEIVKTALLDATLLDYLEENILRFVGAETEIVTTVVTQCIRYKVGVVERDEKESGERRRLNLGHTIGHGLEALDRHRKSHGEYVLNGILYELKLARVEGVIDDDYAKRIEKLLSSALQMPIKLKRIDRLCALIASDKKNCGGDVCCVFPSAPGETVERYFPPKVFEHKMVTLG